jgi:hypothetical protein
MKGKERGGATYKGNIEEENNGYIVFKNTEGKTLPQSGRKGEGGTHEGNIEEDNNGYVVFKWNTTDQLRFITDGWLKLDFVKESLARPMSSSASELHGEVDSIQKPVTTVNDISSTSDICFMEAHLKVFFRERLRGWQCDEKKIRKIGALESVEEKGRQTIFFLSL